MINYNKKDFYDKLNDIGGTTNPRYGKSKNNERISLEDAETIIVGTITPPGVDWFYMSERNPMFEYIDNARGTNLVELKKAYHNANEPMEKNKILNEIKDILKKQKIAFVDVFDEVIRKDGKQNSAADTDIENAILIEVGNEDNKINLPTNAKYICNSCLARDNFKKITKGMNLDIHYCPQYSRREIREKLKEKWNEKLNKTNDLNWLKSFLYH